MSQRGKAMKIQKRTLLKVAAWTSGALLTLTALIGFAHTPAGRPLLALLGVVPGCPVLANIDPIKAQEKRQVWVAKKAGSERAPARPALGFELGRTSKAEVKRTLGKQGFTCSSARKESALDCKREGDDVLLQFDSKDRLVAVDAFRTTDSSVEAVSLLDAAARELASTIGAATQTRGERTASYLDEARFRQVVLEYRYSDYSARVAATNFGRGLRVREQYDLITKSGS
ncbi:MAG TPA: hypothetical protein VHO25_21350 [Polyangiaceae bacterium]|nr:hypothetical protein [Polyangiaceae bacterium]